jgi:hypothetical protein
MVSLISVTVKSEIVEISTENKQLWLFGQFETLKA